LWERNGAYYAQLTVFDETRGKKVVRRTRLEDGDGTPVGTAPEAVKVMNKIKVKREGNSLRLSPKRTPTFAAYAGQYLAHCEALQNKTKGTIHRERSCISNLIPVIGELRLRQINKAVVMGYMATRKKQGMSGRSVNIEVVTLRNVMRHAMAEGLLTDLQIDGVEWLHHEAKKRRLVSAGEIDRVCQAGIERAPLSGQMLADFIRLMASATMVKPRIGNLASWISTKGSRHICWKWRSADGRIQNSYFLRLGAGKVTRQRLPSTRP
jgi:hypothetical protein